MTKTEDRIYVALSRTINLGNYSSVKIEAGYETNLGLKETTEQAFERAWEEVDRELSKQISDATDE